MRGGDHNVNSVGLAVDRFIGVRRDNNHTVRTVTWVLNCTVECHCWGVHFWKSCDPSRIASFRKFDMAVLVGTSGGLRDAEHLFAD